MNLLRYTVAVQTLPASFRMPFPVRASSHDLVAFRGLGSGFNEQDWSLEPLTGDGGACTFIRNRLRV